MAPIDRRSFFKRFAAATAAAVIAHQVGEDLLDPEKLLWTPGAKKIIDLGAHTLITPAPIELKKLSDDHLLDAARYELLQRNPDAAADPRLKFHGVGRIVGTRRLAIVTSGGYGEFTYLDGKLQGGEEARKLLAKVDLPLRFASAYERDYRIRLTDND